MVGWNLWSSCRAEDALAAIEEAVLNRLPYQGSPQAWGSPPYRSMKERKSGRRDIVAWKKCPSASLAGSRSTDAVAESEIALGARPFSVLQIDLNGALTV